MNTNKNLCIITSLLDCPPERSVFSRKERFEQTKLTIQSVKKYIPDVYTVLIDCTNFDEEESTYFNKNVDWVIECSEIPVIKECVYSISKSNGERMYLVHSLNLLMSKINDFPNLQNIFKLSGRYQITKEFDYTDYDHDKCVFKVVDPKLWKNACVSCLFKIPKNVIRNFSDILLQAKIPFEDPGFCTEIFLYHIKDFFPYVEPKVVGCCGYIAPNGIYGEC